MYTKYHNRHHSTYCWFCKDVTCSFARVVRTGNFIKNEANKLYKPDSTSPNPDCIVNIMKALVRIHVASSEFSCAGSSDNTVPFPAEEFCVTFIFNYLQQSSPFTYNKREQFVTQQNSRINFKNNSRWCLEWVVTTEQREL